MTTQPLPNPKRLLAVFAVIFILYLLAIAPASWMAHHGFASEELVSWIYAPVLWSARWCPPLDDAVTTYSFVFVVLVDGP